MRPLTVPDAENVILALQDEIRRSDESRYDHRLHGLLLVAQGMTAPEVSRMLGDSPRTVQYWIRRFDEEGLSGLAEGDRPGRPRAADPGVAVCTVNQKGELIAELTGIARAESGARCSNPRSVIRHVRQSVSTQPRPLGDILIRSGHAIPPDSAPSRSWA